ncbi:MAG: DUF3786 domain-containing protein [Thermodesulfobacteriota bacterium]|nr:DUF3786 domain-containing protein [Thermodesulfobacteriota bacterium]
MDTNYTPLIRQNLSALYENLPDNLACMLPAKQDGDRFVFPAFGKICTLSPEGVFLGKEMLHDARGIILSLYALHAADEPADVTVFRAFKEFENTMPYAGAFATHTEQVLAPHAGAIKARLTTIKTLLNGGNAPAGLGGDFSFVANPVPKIFLCYLVYEADEEFPAAVTCLYSANAANFLPIDALADVGEYTSRAIIDLVAGL